MQTIERQNFDKIVDAIIERMPAHVNALHNTLHALSDTEIHEADTYCAYLLKKHGLDFLVLAYKTVVDDTFAAQVDFFRTKKYRHSTFDEVAKDVYFHPDYMDRYMVGLALTTFLWANHLEIYRFFRQTLPRNFGGSYLEIGSGHGFFLLQAMRYGGFDNFIAVDISPSSIALTDDVVKSLLPEKWSACRFIEMDFLAADDLRPPFAAIVMGEVLEHVEQPAPFLRRIVQLASPKTHIFVTTCVNAPAIDHIYLFHNVGEVEKMIADCGLTIRDKKIIPYPGKTLQQSERNDLPINVAYVLGR